MCIRDSHPPSPPNATPNRLTLAYTSGSIRRAQVAQSTVDRWLSLRGVCSCSTSRASSPTGTIAVLVHVLDDGVFAVTDRGTTSAILAMADIDLDREHIRPIWDAICASVGRPVPPGVEPEDFQIAAIADANDLAGTVMSVESAMLRAETLRWTIPAPGR